MGAVEAAGGSCPEWLLKPYDGGIFCVADVVAEVYRIGHGAADGLLRQVMAVEGAPSLCFREAYFQSYSHGCH